MMTRPTRWIVSAILLFLVAGVALADLGSLTLSGPAPNAQVGVFYNSALIATGGVPFYSYSIISGSLPPGLTFPQVVTGVFPSINTGAISGTPTTAGTFTFTASVSDSQVSIADPHSPSTGPDSQAAARRRTLSQSGNHAASISSTFSITVSPASGAVGAPASLWTLCLMMAGLAGAGFLRLRQHRRT